MWPLSCSTLQFAKHLLPDVARTIADLGFTQIDLWTSPTLATHLDPSRDDPEAVRGLLASHGLSISGLSLFRNDRTAKLLQIEYAARLGCPRVIFCADPLPYKQYLDETLKPLADQAAKYGVQLAIENHLYRPIDSIESMERIVQDLGGAPHVGFTLAPPHIVGLGETLEEAIRRLRDRIFCIYLWDISKHWKPEHGIEFGDGEEQMPGNGQIDFGRFLDAVRASGWQGPVDYCCHNTGDWPIERTKAAIARSLAYVRPMLG